MGVEGIGWCVGLFQFRSFISPDRNEALQDDPNVSRPKKPYPSFTCWQSGMGRKAVMIIK